MPEQRRKGNECLAVTCRPGVAAGPATPGGSGQGIGRRAKTQQVDNHSLVVADPIAEAAKAGGRLPAHRNCIGATRHPIPIDSIEDGISSAADGIFSVVGAVEILFCIKHATEQQSCVD